ncbi:hypothetical protein YDYSY3_34370 [Paenibacillus chitinolyticus]|uniref:hypothetical protein n=1 Tax=Paenibacillus chitinolyticus TaxID=79263 RepID=UPI0026E4DDB7|nr:hypothetical protein [Paenibacillus chitinolyticus]GKS12437.1 hypothetical protein YDYSY3_34370 [Paenibacillus chitinolyticus]
MFGFKDSEFGKGFFSSYSGRIFWLGTILFNFGKSPNGHSIHRSDSAYVVVRPGFPGKLPYGLQADTDMSVFAIGRLVGRNKQVHEGVVSRSLSFFQDDLSIVVGFDEPSNHLAFLRIESIDPSEARLRFYDGLNAQKASLVDSMDDCLAQWQSANPVHCWRQRMTEGDSIFNGNGGIGEG